MSELTPFEKSAETANKLAGALALHQALKEIAKVEEAEGESRELELQKEILIQAVITLSPFTAEA